MFAFLPAQQKTELANAIVAAEAARTTLQKKGSPSTEEGRDAQRSMESRQRTAEKELAELLDLLFGGVRVFQAGGQEAQDGNDLTDRINRAAKASAIRLYSQFDAADHDQWSKVLDEARKGNLEALKAVGHSQEVDKHPVCQKLLAYIGPGKKGAEIRDNFEAPPYGWPRDAIDGALYALLAAGHLKANDVSSKPVDAKSLDRAKLTQTSFQRESVNITPPQLIKIRSLFSTVGVPCQPKDELVKVPALLAKLREQAAKAGGAAPAPEMPKLASVESVEGQSGNPKHARLALAYDVAIGICRISPEQLNDFRVEADWRFGKQLEKENPNRIYSAYFEKGKMNGAFLQDWVLKDSEAKLPDSIDDTRQGGTLLSIGEVA
ncbi:hypothetical protein [Burkholderia pyrrocinia]